MVYKSLDRTDQHKLQLKKLRAELKDLTAVQQRTYNEVLELRGELVTYQNFVGKLMNDIVNALSNDAESNQMLNVKVWVRRTAELMQRVGVFHW